MVPTLVPTRKSISWQALWKTKKVRSVFLSSARLRKSFGNFFPKDHPIVVVYGNLVKSVKYHPKHVLSGVKLTFEEYSTVLAQVEACLNGRSLVALSGDDGGCDNLTPGHFLIGRPLEALPDPAFSYRPLTLLRRWHLCLSLLRHFWQK